jgi:tetratricopeptide (TPR) repeat protein
MQRILNFIVLFLIISAGCVIITGSSVAAFKNVKIGEDAPKFNLKEIDSNESVSLDSYFTENKVTIVIFWSTWSPRSQKQLGEFIKVKSEYGDKGVDIIAVNVEKEEATPEELNKMKEIQKELGVDFKMVLDSGLSIFNDYGVVAVPSTVLLDSEGVIKKTYDGYPTSALLDMKIDIEVMLGIREPEKDVQVAEDKGPKILKKAKLRYGLGRKLIDRGMASKAVRELEKSAEIDKNYDLPLVLLGEVYESEYRRVRKKAKKAEKLDKAIDAFNRAIERNAINLFAYSGLVRVYSTQGKFKEADEAMKTIIKEDSNFVTGIVANGILLQAKGNHDEAIVEFKRALEYNRNLPKVKYLMAKSYEKIEDYENAALSLKESFKQLSTTVQLNMMQGAHKSKKSLTH